MRDYLVGTFHLDPQATGAMPLSADSTGSPSKEPWDGVALAVILPKDALTLSGSCAIEQVQCRKNGGR